MSSARLHPGYAFAAAMRPLVAWVRVLLARPLLVFQQVFFTSLNGRTSGFFLPGRFVLLGHGKSFRVSLGLNRQNGVPFRFGSDRREMALDGLRTNGFLDLRIYAAHDIGNGFGADQILFPDLKAELGFQVHDEFKAIQAADIQVVDKQGIIPHQLRIDQESLRQYCFNSAAGVQLPSNLCPS